MPKIRVETEVPSSEYCDGCIYKYYDMAGFYWCILLHKKIPLGRRCDECKQAEVNDEKINQ